MALSNNSNEIQQGLSLRGHSFIQQTFTYHLLCSWHCLGAGDMAETKTDKTPKIKTKLCPHGSYDLVGRDLLSHKTRNPEISGLGLVDTVSYSFHLFTLPSSVCRLCPQPCNLIVARLLPLLQASHCMHINPVV